MCGGNQEESAICLILKLEPAFGLSHVQHHGQQPSRVLCADESGLRHKRPALDLLGSPAFSASQKS